MQSGSAWRSFRDIIVPIITPSVLLVGTLSFIAAARNGMLFSAGLITGEALLGIILAIPIAIAQNTEVMSFGVTPLALPGLVLLGESRLQQRTFLYPCGCLRAGGDGRDGRRV